MGSATLKHRLLSATPGVLKPYWQRLEDSPLGYRLARGTFWSFAAALSSRFLGLLSSVIVARILGKEGMGELGVISSTVGLFGSIAGFGLGMTSTKYVAEFRKTEPQRAGRIAVLTSATGIVTSTLAAAVLFWLAPVLADKSLAAPQLTSILRIGSLVLILGTVTGVQSAALSGFEAFKAMAGINLVVGVLTFPFMVVGAHFSGVKGAVLGSAAAMALNAVVNNFVLRKLAAAEGVPLSLSGVLQERRILWSFSLPSALCSVMMGPANWVCYSIFARQPGGYSEMGVFNVASQWRAAILYFPALLAGVALPVLCSLTQNPDQKQYWRIVTRTIYLSYGAALAMALPIGLGSKLVMASYGSGFRSGWLALVVVALSAVIAAGMNAVGQIYASKAFMWAGAALNGLWSFYMIAFGWLLRHNGALGFAAALLLAGGLHTIGVLVHLRWVVVGNERRRCQQDEMVA
jgi:O-antigen/teichoic acid export membrane protein